MGAPRSPQNRKPLLRAVPKAGFASAGAALFFGRYPRT